MVIFLYSFNTILTDSKASCISANLFLPTKADELKLMEYTRKNHNIIHLVKQISPWDIELESMCENYQEYNALIAELTKEFSNIIQKVETAIISEDYVFPAQKMIFED